MLLKLLVHGIVKSLKTEYIHEALIIKKKRRNCKYAPFIFASLHCGSYEDVKRRFAGISRKI